LSLPRALERMSAAGSFRHHLGAGHCPEDLLGLRRLVPTLIGLLLNWRRVPPSRTPKYVNWRPFFFAYAKKPKPTSATDRNLEPGLSTAGAGLAHEAGGIEMRAQGMLPHQGQQDNGGCFLGSVIGSPWSRQAVPAAPDLHRTWNKLVSGCSTAG
jgi:hypothetical protein